MFEHELLFAPAVQRSIYAARNDDVHLRLRVKLTIVDRHKSRAWESDESSRVKRRKAADPSNKDHGASSSISLSMKQRVEGGLVVDSSELDVQADTDVNMQPSTSASGESDVIIPVEKPIDSTTSLSGQGSEYVTPHNGGKSLCSQTSNQTRTTVARQYQLCQFGHPEPGRNIVVRSAILVKIHGDAFGFLSLLGYSFEDEYVRRGYSFLYGNLCRISVFKKYKLSKQHDPFSVIIPQYDNENAEADSPWMVEITSAFVSQENVNNMSEEINIVRNLLAGSVSY
ncbi:hypothetical protein MVEG_09158 [Podila verticillata NRRL 6337]|nr:hypothetical protein MVEG_09158 [Podila verticillata NRRL 6337]